MTSTDLTTGQQPATSLTLAPEQTYWTENQVAALRHMGIEDASPGDLSVFFHVVKRTGLDPFARQIHMIGRNSKNQRTQQWETKYTIQTGIDGYRLIGHRAANQAHVKVRVSAPEWAREDGQWMQFWSPQWGMPLAARVTVYRDGEPFPGVALFNEYKQTTKSGDLTSMWRQRPAGQLAKCAEALAWRMAFPQDLANVYVEDEMHQASNPEPVQETASVRVSAADFTAPASQPAEAKADPDAPKPPTQAMTRKMFATLRDVGVGDRDSSLAYVSDVVGREVGSSKDLTRDEVSAVIDAAEAELAQQNGTTQPAEDATSYDNDQPLDGWPETAQPGGAA